MKSLIARWHALTPNLRGIIWVGLSGVLFSLLNVFTLYPAQHLNSYVMSFLRYSFGALFLLLVAYALGNGLVQTAKRDRAQAAVAQADRDTRAGQRVQLEAILAGTAQPTPFENPADPSRMASGYGGQHALLPTAPVYSSVRRPSVATGSAMRALARSIGKSQPWPVTFQ